MLKAVERLINAMYQGSKHMQVGNHGMERDFCDRDKVLFSYHGTTICEHNLKTGETTYNDGGWTGYVSTTRALSSYNEEFGGIVWPKKEYYINAWGDKEKTYVGGNVHHIETKGSLSTYLDWQENLDKNFSEKIKISKTA